MRNLLVGKELGKLKKVRKSSVNDQSDPGQRLEEWEKV